MAFGFNPKKKNAVLGCFLRILSDFAAGKSQPNQTKILCPALEAKFRIAFRCQFQFGFLFPNYFFLLFFSHGSKTRFYLLFFFFLFTSAHPISRTRTAACNIQEDELVHEFWNFSSRISRNPHFSIQELQDFQDF